MLKQIQVIDAERVNFVLATRVLGWTLSEDGSQWCKRDAKLRIYRPFKPVTEWEPVDVELHALHLIDLLSKQSELWFIQVEAQGGIYRCFVEHEGERRNGFFKATYFATAVSMAILLAHGIRPQDVELTTDAITSDPHNQQLPRRGSPVDPAVTTDNFIGGE